MFTLGVQYYRPPFPNSRFWQDDFARMRDSGLNAVQLWILWSWVEAAPDDSNSTTTTDSSLWPRRTR